jgi:arginyl-tRNA synthetase
MNWLEETRFYLKKDLAEAAEAAKADGELNFEELPDFVIERPREKAHGDFAANIAMLLARQAKMAPHKIAEILVGKLYKEAPAVFVDSVEIAGAGFINFRMKASWLAGGLLDAVKRGEAFGESEFGAKSRINIEFVSANPTGELHLGNARGAAIGDSLANIMQAAGYDVEREYYINDAGKQIENFGLSLEVRYLQQLGQDVPFPEDGYHGEDITRTVSGYIEIEGDKLLNVEPHLRREILTRYALEKKISAIREALSHYGVEYDTWFSEQTLHDEGAVQKVVEQLGEDGLLLQKDDAIWFAADKFGCEKPEVLVRANGIPTYYTADIAYHKNKFDRGFGRCINIWGADHHGHVARLKAAVGALGYPAENLEVILMQLVRLFSGGEIMRMSKRAGTYVTLEELLEEVGRDAARFFFVMRSADSQMDFDLDLAKSQSMDNPVYYVQYAHARINSIILQAEEQGITLPEPENVNFDLLVEESERDLIRKLLELPDEIVAAAVQEAPHKIAAYVMELSALFHSFYGNCRVLGVDADVQAARLWLCRVTAGAVKKCLTLLGVSAPVKM